MENYDIFGDDLGSGMLDSLAELGATDSGFGNQQSNTSQRQGSNADNLMQNFANQPPSYTQIGQQQQQQQSLNQPNKMNPNQAYPDYSSQYAQYAAAGQAGLGAYGVPPSQNPSRPMTGYAPYHQPGVPSSSMHYPDYSVQNPSMMRPGGAGSLVPPSQQLAPPPSRMASPGPPHVSQQQQQFGGYRPSSQDLYAQQMRWNEQQGYGSAVPHHYPPTGTSAYRQPQPHAYPSSLPRPPQSQAPPGPPVQQTSQQNQSSGPHSMPSYMNRTQGPSNVMSQAQYPQSMYPSSSQQYPDYHHSSGGVSRVASVPQSTPSYGTPHTPHHTPSNQQQYTGMSAAQHPQYNSQYSQYYQGQAQGSQGISSNLPQTSSSNPMAGSPYTSYGNPPGMSPISPAINGNQGYRPPGPGGYVQIPQSSPRPPIASPRPPAPSPRPSAPSTPTIPMSPAQQQGMPPGPPQSMQPQNQGPSSLQQLEQMVMPSLKNSPSPKPHLPSGVMSPLSGPKTPMSPGMVAPKTPLSPSQWQPPPMSRQGPGPGSMSKQGSHPPPQPQYHQQQQQQLPPMSQASNSPLGMQLPPQHIPRSPMSTHSSLDNSMNSNCNSKSNSQDNSEISIDQLTSTLDTSMDGTGTNSNGATEELNKPSTPTYQSSPVQPPTRNSASSTGTPLNELSTTNSDNVNNDSLNSLSSQLSNSNSGQQLEDNKFSSPTSNKIGSTPHESPSIESESNLGLCTDSSIQQSQQNSTNNSSSSDLGTNVPTSTQPPASSNILTGASTPTSTSTTPTSLPNSFQQQPIPITNSHGALSSLTNSGSSSPVPPLGPMSQGNQMTHQLPSNMMNYQVSQPNQNSYGANGPSQGMTSPLMSSQSNQPHQYPPVYSQASNEIQSQPPPSMQPGYYNSTSGNNYPPSQYPLHSSMGIVPPTGPPGPHPGGIPHGPSMQLQYEIHQIQNQLQLLYNNPPTPQTQMQVSELQERLRILQQQQAAQGPFPPMHGLAVPPPPHGGPPMMYGQPIPMPDMSMDQFPPDGIDDFKGKGKGKKKERKPREPKGPGKGKGKGKKPLPPLDFDPMVVNQQAPPPYGIPPGPGSMSAEVYDFQDVPPEIPEKKQKKTRKPREQKSPKEKKTKEPKPVKEKSPKKSRKKKGTEDTSQLLNTSMGDDSFGLDPSLGKTEENLESDPKNGIGAAGIIAAEGGSTGLSSSGEGDTSTQDGTIPTTIEENAESTVDAVSTEPLNTDQTTPKPTPKKKSKPKMKSGGSGKKRPTKTTLIASLAAKKKKKRNRSDSEGCSDLDATPPPSPPPEEDNSNKRRSGRNNTRKKYIDDIVLALSDDELIVPSKSSPAKNSEPAVATITSTEDLGGVTPTTQSEAPTPGIATPSNAPTPSVTADESSQNTNITNNKPNFVYVNTTEEDTMIIQHILSVRMGKRDIIASDSSDDEEEKKPDVKPIEDQIEKEVSSPCKADALIVSEAESENEVKVKEGKEEEIKEEVKEEAKEEIKEETKEEIKEETKEEIKEEAKEEIKEEIEEKMDSEPSDQNSEVKNEDTTDGATESSVPKDPQIEETKVEPEENSDENTKKSETTIPETKPPKPKKEPRVLETVEVEEFYVKYKNFSYLHCEWKTEEELQKGDKRANAKIKRFKQKMSSRDIFEFLEEDPFNPEYVEVDRILDMSEVKDPATGKVTKNYLVKWRALAYDECTWELEDDIEPEKLKQYYAFCNPPPRDQWKVKKRPKAGEWIKLDDSPVYKNGNTLRPYQLEGLNWLNFSWFNGRNCILADEMGLGKTIQSLTFVDSVHRYGIRGPFLVIAPLSTVPNWQREFETWTDLNVVVYHGSVASRNMIQEYELFYRHPDNPQMNIKDVFKFHVLITTFEIVLTDVLDLKDFPWRLCIIDEAHRLKNKNCKLLEGLRLLNLEHRVLLSGTPLQNNINELFSLLNFLEPAQFSSDENFKKEFGELTTDTQVQKLQALLKPMMLRRLKEDVEKSIAPKEETIIEVELTNMQKKYYRGILEKNFSFLSKGTSSANIPNLMNTMMELRKCCIHPYLLNGAEDEIQRDYRIVNGGPDDGDLYYKALVASSGKMVLVDKLLPKLRANGHRVLVFSQMVRCLDILEDYLIYMKYPFERIDGRIRGPLRQAAIDRFSKPDSDRFVFLLCTKAGGLGINLTAADTVIIYDSDWNPQNDLQAQARCHRIGQAKMVKVYRLICRNTYEREMFDRASLKLGLDKAVLQSMNTSQSQAKGVDTNPNKQLSKKEVEDLLKKGAYGALMDEDNAGDKFCEEDIDCILQRRTQIITLETGEKGSTFSKASFASTGIREDINVDDPDFWNKWAKRAEIDMDDMNQRDTLVIHEPRRRTQIKRYGHDEQIMEINSDLESTSDSDEEGGGGGIGDRTRGRGRQKKSKHRRSRRGLDEDYHCDDGVVEYGRWSKSECYKIEKGLLTFGWARWTEILEAGQFRPGWSEKEIEDCARMILVHCVNNFRGDEKVRSFVQDLIHPTDDGSKVTRNHLGLANPVSRGGRKSKKKRGDKQSTPSPEPLIEWIKEEKFDPDVHLDGNYKKHVGKHANKVLLRIRMLYYIKQEIIGEYAAKIKSGAPASEIPICPVSMATDTGPTSWWDREADTSLLIGTFKHGYERYNIMRMDPDLCFLPRCGPPDGSAVLAEISAEVNEEELDKAVGGDDDEESNMDPAVAEKQSDKLTEENSCSAKESEAEPKEEKQTEDGETVIIKTEAEEGTGSTDPEKLPFPIATDLNTRIRKLITSFQRYFKKEEVRNAQKAKRQERKEKIDQIVREREKQKLEVYQKRWSKKEESDFYRTISAYGILYNRKDKTYDWSKFRAISRLDKKFDETLTEYYRAFYAMCKRICGKKLSEEEEFDLIQVPVEPVAEDRARKTLERIDLLSKIREEVIYNPQLEERLKLCQPSLDLPEWWVPGKHDKDLLLGAARHGLGRTDIFYLNDADLSFREILRRHIAGESLIDHPDKSRSKSEKRSRNDDEKKSKRDMVDIEIKDIKQEREDARKAKAAEAASAAALAEKERELEAEKKESTPDRTIDGENTSKPTILNTKDETKDQEESMDLSSSAEKTIDETTKSCTNEVVIKKEPEEISDKGVRENFEASEKPCEEKMEIDQPENDTAKELNLSTKTKENEPKIKCEQPNEEAKDTEHEKPDEPASKRRKIDEATSVKSPADYSNKAHKRDDEESTKSSGSDMNEVQVEIKDEFKITIKLPAEKMKKVEVQVKGSPKFSVPEPPAPASSQQSFPTLSLMTTEELLNAHSKSILNPEELSSENLNALGSLMNQMNPIRWPRDKAIQIRLEHIVYAVEKGEWPVSKFFSSATLPDIFEYTTPQGTPDTSTPIRDTPTPISECSDLAPAEELIMTLPPAQTTTTMASGGARRGRRRRIAIDVETERAKLQALLNQGLHNSIPQLPRLSSLRGNNHHANHDKDDSEGETQINRNKFQPPPAHSNAASSLTASLLRSSHQKQQIQPSTHRSSPTPRFAHNQGSTLDLSLKSSDRNIAAAAMNALSSLSSVTVTPVTLQSPRANNSSNNNTSNSAPMDLSATRAPPTRRERERERREQLQMEQQLLAERITRSLRNLEKPPSPEPESERPKASKLENMLDKLRKRKLGDNDGEPQAPLPVEKEKRKKKLDEIVFGLSASKGQGQGNNLSSLFSPPVRGNSRGNSPASSRLQSPPTSAQQAFSQFASQQQNLKDIATSQANLLNNSLLSATLSLFSSAAGKELSRQLAGQASSGMKGKESNSRASAPGPSPMSEIPKCDLSRLAELAVPKFDLFSQDAKVNKWLAEHANLTPERPVSPDLLDGRRRRRPRVDPMLLDWSKLSGEENVTVVHRMTGKKITGPKAPQLKHVAQWLMDNPMYDVDPRWSDIVKEKSNLSKGHGDKKKGPGRPQMMSSPATSMPTSTSTTTVPTSSSSSNNPYASLQGFGSIPGLNPNLLAGLGPLGSLDPKNPLFMPFGGLGSLGGLGNLSSLGNLGSLGSLSSLGLTNSLFGFGLPGMPGMDLGNDKSKETPTSGASAQTTQSSSSSSKKDDKNKKNSMSSQQNMLSSALPFLFPNPGLMYNPLGLGSFPLGGGMNPPYGNLSQSSLLNGLGGMNTGSGGKKSSGSASKSNNNANAAAALGLAGLAGLNIPSFSKKDLPQNLTGGSSSQRSKSPAAKSTTSQPSSCATPGLQSSMNPEDSDDESMKSLMGNHADDLPEDDSPGENAERIVLKESKELEKEMAQQKMETRRERRVRDRSSVGQSSESHRGGLTAAERQLLMVKKKERLAKEDQSPAPRSSSGRTTRRSAAAASRLEDTLNKIRPSEGPMSEDGSEDQ